jgi:hypothetical protein
MKWQENIYKKKKAGKCRHIHLQKVCLQKDREHGDSVMWWSLWWKCQWLWYIFNELKPQCNAFQLKADTFPMQKCSNLELIIEDWGHDGGFVFVWSKCSFHLYLLRPNHKQTGHPERGFLNPPSWIHVLKYTNCFLSFTHVSLLKIIHTEQADVVSTLYMHSGGT